MCIKLNPENLVPAGSILVLGKGPAMHSGHCPLNVSLSVELLFPVLHQWLEFKYLQWVL